METSKSAIGPGTPAGRSGRTGRRMTKRIVEATLVALPGLLLIAATVAGTFDGPGALIPAGVIIAVALGVFTGHWIAYAVLLAIGTYVMFDRSILALAFWVFGGIDVLIALGNLIAITVRKTMATRLRQGRHQD